MLLSQSFSHSIPVSFDHLYCFLVGIPFHTSIFILPFLNLQTSIFNARLTLELKNALINSSLVFDFLTYVAFARLKSNSAHVLTFLEIHLSLLKV